MNNPFADLVFWPAVLIGAAVCYWVIFGDILEASTFWNTP